MASQLGDIAMESSQRNKARNLKRQNEHSIFDLWNKIKQYNIHKTELPEVEETDGGTKKN
jgi:hypothetical protein